MNLLARIREMQRAEAEKNYIGELVFGDHITVLRLQDGRTGAAMHFAQDLDVAPRKEVSRELVQASAWEALRHLGAAHPLRASAAVAAANALAAGKAGLQSGHMLDVLDLQPDDVFGMVGNFIPLVERVTPRVKRLMIFETVEQASEDGILPASEEPRLLPQCSVVLITGTTLVNGTIEDVLSWCRSARAVVVAGPSTVMLSDAWRGTPATWLAGTRILDPEVMLSGVRGGASFRDLRSLLEKVLLPVPH